MEFGGNSGSKSKWTLEEWIISVESTISTKWTKAKQILEAKREVEDFNNWIRDKKLRKASKKV